MRRIPLLVLAVLAAAGCGTSSSGSGVDSAPYVWDLPPGFPVPRVPEGNPMSAEKVELGRHLFYDVRLSGNETFSCASCHEQALAFTDGRARAIGSTGELHPRASMSLVNVAYANTLTWANDLLRSLEQQALVPMFGETPVELGLSGREGELLERLRAEPRYQAMFAAAFPRDEDPYTLEHIVQSLASFQRTLLSGRSPFDRYNYDRERDAISESTKRGMALFFSERLECFHCHGGFNFSDSVGHQGTEIEEVMFHNTALYNLDGEGAYPPENTGLMEISGKASDMGRFKAPTLRNIEVRAPYMHDGSVATLEDAIDHYAAGGRRIESGPYAGNGAESPLRSEFVRGFELSPDEKSDIIEFLRSLTDREFLTDPRFSNPWLE
ncbi:methanobactin export MATE transporter MbnM [Vulgatibacter incomptus]|uniref:Methylamine utilization protein mauG n=1 Tax=Vulgatibacter incomptus TaxID=1391653 RepID=A0A0K1PCQ7_9BACT|nr:methanobactin export MATE transporter MbnM [Vulgatibacter incomptus]AKU91300.1 Methylamine utilization protein mauG [Vulgatibacter incomptus]